MALKTDEVEKVALLARLDLSPAEVAQLARELTQIVDYVNQLESLDTDGVEPMAHAIELHNVMVEDEPEPCLSRDAALRNAPKHDGACYLVPAVLGE